MISEADLESLLDQQTETQFDLAESQGMLSTALFIYYITLGGYVNEPVVEAKKQALDCLRYYVSGEWRSKNEYK